MLLEALQSADQAISLADVMASGASFTRIQTVCDHFVTNREILVQRSAGLSSVSAASRSLAFDHDVWDMMVTHGPVCQVTTSRHPTLSSRRRVPGP